MRLNGDKKNVFKLYTEIPFHFYNINKDSTLSSIALN